MLLYMYPVTCMPSSALNNIWCVSLLLKESADLENDMNSLHKGKEPDIYLSTHSSRAIFRAKILNTSCVAGSKFTLLCNDCAILAVQQLF